MDQPVVKTTNTKRPSPTQDNLLSGITLAGKFFDWHILITKTVSIILLLNGIKGLFDQIRLIFFVYPKLPEYYQALDFAPEVYQKIFISAVILTSSALIDSFYGTIILFKSSQTVKIIHTLIGFILLATTIIISQLGLDLNPKEILYTVQQAYISL